MTTETYTAMVDGVEDDARCSCGNCEWQGLAKDAVNVDDCVLTPGDPSPVGRCPECEALAYVDKPEPDMFKVAKITVSGALPAGTTAQGLMNAGVWFRCKPLPDLQFEFTVKAEDAWYLPSHQNGKGLHQTHFTLTETWSR